MTVNFKRINYILIILLALVQADLLFAAGDGKKKLDVFVSIQPQAYFVERIGGKRVSVDVLVPPGKSPATYSLSPVQMSRLSNASILFRIGVPFENRLMEKIQDNTNVKIVDTRQGIRLRTMEGRHTHGHHRHGNHDAAGKDPHIWLDPSMVKIQAGTIFRALAHADPQGEEEYKDNLDIFINDLDRLDSKIRAALLPLKGRAFFVFHPSFGYFADAYDLEQVPVEMEGKTPKGKDLTALIKTARNRNVRVIFVQPQFDRTTALKIAAAIGGDVLPLDPLAYDYMNNLNNIMEKIVHALKDK